MALQDKTEPGTPKKREEAREEGRVAKSAEIGSAAVLLASILILRAAGPYLISGMMEVIRSGLSTLHLRQVTVESLPNMAASWAITTAGLCLPVMAGAAAVGLAANVLQVGFRATSKSIAPNLTRLDPLKGLARLVSGRSLMELLKSVVKVVVVGWVAWGFLRAEYPALLDLPSLSPAGLGGAIAGLCWRLLARATAAMLIIAVLDYMYQRLSFELSLRMTKQEVKDEFKRSEGDPHIKARIRQRQREIARRRMMQDVAKSDVVITNPTHVAVALKYDTDKMAAPQLVAKGQRLLAERIKAVAEANHVPMIENAPVARLLYKTVEIGQQIPEELYQAVAEILAFVFRLSKNRGMTYGS